MLVDPSTLVMGSSVVAGRIRGNAGAGDSDQWHTQHLDSQRCKEWTLKDCMILVQLTYIRIDRGTAQSATDMRNRQSAKQNKVKLLLL